MNPIFKLRKTEKYGRGVYATRNIRKGEVIERSPCLVFSKNEHTQFSDTLMNFYVFGWPNGGAAETALALGVGSLFNHDTKPNVTYVADLKTQQMVFRACSPIKKGEQLFINYGYDPKEVRKRWEIKKLQEKKEDDETPEIFGNPEMHPDNLEPKYLGLEASLKEAQRADDTKAFWDPSANGGTGAEVQLRKLPKYGVIKNDKFDFNHSTKDKPIAHFSDEMLTFQEPEAPLIDLSMSRADAELTLAFLIVVFLVGMFQGLITARGY